MDFGVLVGFWLIVFGEIFLLVVVGDENVILFFEIVKLFGVFICVDLCLVFWLFLVDKFIIEFIIFINFDFFLILECYVRFWFIILLLLFCNIRGIGNFFNIFINE